MNKVQIDKFKLNGHEVKQQKLSKIASILLNVFLKSAL